MSPLGSLGGIQFSSIHLLDALLIVSFLGQDGPVDNIFDMIILFCNCELTHFSQL